MKKKLVLHNNKSYVLVSSTQIHKPSVRVTVGTEFPISKKREIIATKKAVRYLSVLNSIQDTNKKAIFDHENNQILVN
jgi:ribosomal protein S4